MLNCFGAHHAYQFFGTQIEIKKAPEPTDVFWENLGYSQCKKVQKRTLTFLLSIVLLIICYIVLVLLNYGKYELDDEL